MSKVYVKYFIVVILGLISSNLSSQNITQVLNLGDQLYDKKDYFGSIKIYKTALNIDSTNVDVLYKYAKNLSQINDPKKASRYFLKAYILDNGKSYPELAYELAESYRTSGEYRKSRRYYTKAIRPYRRNKDDYWYKKISQSKNAATWADKHDKKNESQVVKPISEINTNASEFAGTIFQDEYYFSALIADSVGQNDVIFDQDYFSKLYHYSSKTQKPEVIELKESNKFSGKHLANLSFYKENQVFFSVCDTNLKCEIWEGYFDNNQISQAKKLDPNINASESSNTQAFVFELDGNTYILFSSNRERGFGGFDLWISKKESFGFDKAINLGAEINTLGNEITPFYSIKSKTLFFASDWHLGFGAYDLFSAIGQLNKYEKPENLGKPINSSQDEYYFSVADQVAIFSSNRKEGNVEKGNNCCNDLFQTPYELEEIEELDPEKIKVTVDVLNKYLPLNLYFHNDYPDPNTRDTSSKANYLTLAKNYQLLQQEYEDKYSSQLNDTLKEDGIFEIQQFFENDLEEGIKSLEFFTPLLYKELQKGSQIELTIKGYASSLSESDYNLNLTLRRIQSLINYLNEYDAGKIQPYINGSASNGGALKIKKLPYGEFAFENELEESNKILAIYSPLATSQRKIEVMAVTNHEGKEKSLDGSKLADKAIIKLEQSTIDLGQFGNKETLKTNINIQNIGLSELRIFTINSNCECASVKYPLRIQANKNGQIQVEIDTRELKGNTRISLSIFSNTNPNIHVIDLLLRP